VAAVGREPVLLGVPVALGFKHPARRWQTADGVHQTVVLEIGVDPVPRTPILNLNQIARWANTHAETAEAVEVIAHLGAIEREIARVARFGD